MNPNSALIWLPKIVAAGLPTPRTEIVEYGHHSIASIFDGAKSVVFENLVAGVVGACERIGYPVFVRTDLASAKHSGPGAYRISNETEVASRMYATLEDNEMKFWLEAEGPKAILVREWIAFDSPFSAFADHPINREWRFFADGNHVFCFHPYWPEDAITFYADAMVAPIDWRERLRELHKVPDCIDELKELSIRAAALYGATASVDIAQDKHGKWWVIDMALAEGSVHWQGCENEKMQIHRFYLPPERSE